MKRLTKNQTGFSSVEIVIVLIVIAVIGAVGWKISSSLINKHNSNNQTSTGASGGQGSASPTGSGQKAAATGLIWRQTVDSWQATSAPPTCPAQPMLKMPADITKVTSILYPGQARGGNYKPHGGFRFDTSANADISVKAPIGGYLMRGASYLADGEVQYTFDVMNNCGIMFRVGHLRVIPDNLFALTKSWPAPVENGSQTYNITPAVLVKTGDVLATSVGIIKEKNTFFDFGVYDYRQNNDASKIASYQAAHGQFPELAYHAVCWFSWFPNSDSAKIQSLPSGDENSGKTSDYCN